MNSTATREDHGNPKKLNLFSDSNTITLDASNATQDINIDLSSGALAPQGATGGKVPLVMQVLLDHLVLKVL